MGEGNRSTGYFRTHAGRLYVRFDRRRSAVEMPTDIFPEIDIPVVAVISQYSGLNTTEMEQRLTERESRSEGSQGGRQCESVEQRFCGFQVGRIEPFGKPVVNRLEECCRIGGTVLVAQQPGKARGGAQFPGQGALPARPAERLPEVTLGRCRGSGLALQQKKLTLDAQQLGD